MAAASLCHPETVKDVLHFTAGMLLNEIENAVKCGRCFLSFLLLSQLLVVPNLASPSIYSITVSGISPCRSSLCVWSDSTV